MADIAVVFHSGYGHTQRVAQAVAAGAGAQLLAIDADGNLAPQGWELLAAVDAIILGAPTYMGGPSWQFKKFADASSKVWFVQGWKDKLFAGFTNSAAMNGDGPRPGGFGRRRHRGSHRTCWFRAALFSTPARRATPCLA